MGLHIPDQQRHYHENSIADASPRFVPAIAAILGLNLKHVQELYWLEEDLRAAKQISGHLGVIGYGTSQR